MVEMMKGRYRSLTHLRPRLLLAVTVMTLNVSRMPYTLSQIPRPFLRYQGRCLDGKRLVSTWGPELELVGLVMSPLEVGSGEMCSETPFGVFKERYTVHMLFSCSSAEWFTTTML